MRIKDYFFEKFIAQSTHCLGRARKGHLYSDAPFDRRTFNPITNENERRTLARLRSPGGARFFRWAWHRWAEKGYGMMSRVYSQALMYTERNNIEIKGKKIIDAGCGNSADTEIITDLGGIAFGLDLFPREQSRKFHNSPQHKGPIESFRQSEFLIQDICNQWPHELQNSDIILSNAVIDLMTEDDRKHFYFESWFNLKKGGYLIIYVCPLKNGHGFNKHKEVERLKTLGFSNVAINQGIIIATK